VRGDWEQLKGKAKAHEEGSGSQEGRFLKSSGSLSCWEKENEVIGEGKGTKKGMREKCATNLPK